MRPRWRMRCTKLFRKVHGVCAGIPLCQVTEINKRTVSRDVQRAADEGFCRKILPAFPKRADALRMDDQSATDRDACADREQQTGPGRSEVSLEGSEHRSAGVRFRALGRRSTAVGADQVDNDRSFFTRVTPGADHAAFSASSRSCQECTFPLSVTVPSRTSTKTLPASMSACRLNAA